MAPRRRRNRDIDFAGGIGCAKRRPLLGSSDRCRPCAARQIDLRSVTPYEGGHRSAERMNQGHVGGAFRRKTLSSTAAAEAVENVVNGARLYEARGDRSPSKMPFTVRTMMTCACSSSKDASLQRGIVPFPKRGLIVLFVYRYCCWRRCISLCQSLLCVCASSKTHSSASSPTTSCVVIAEPALVSGIRRAADDDFKVLIDLCHKHGCSSSPTKCNPASDVPAPSSRVNVTASSPILS